MRRKFTIFALFYFVFEGKFQVQAPPGGLYSEGRFNGGFFGLRFWGAYIWKGLIHGGAYFRNFYGIRLMSYPLVGKYLFTLKFLFPCCCF